MVSKYSEHIAQSLIVLRLYTRKGQTIFVVRR